MTSDSGASSRPLTEADLLAAFDKIANEPRRVCGVTEPHVVHPKAEGWTRCANCGQPVKVATDALGRKREAR